MIIAIIEMVSSAIRLIDSYKSSIAAFSNASELILSEYHNLTLQLKNPSYTIDNDIVPFLTVKIE